MLGYTYENVNPKGRKTGDCSTRALAKTLGITWEQALTEQYEMSMKTKYNGSCKQVVEKVLANHGWVKMKQPRKADGKKYKVFEMDKLLNEAQMKAGVFVTVANHHTCIKDFNIIDIWYCGNMSVGNYYIKVK